MFVVTNHDATIFKLVSLHSFICLEAKIAGFPMDFSMDIYCCTASNRSYDSVDNLAFMNCKCNCYNESH